MFSAEAKNDDASQRILVHALVDTVEAIPGTVYLTPIVEATGWFGLSTHRHALDYAAYAYNFYQPSVSAGTYTIRIQWKVSGGTGYARCRTLTVIALPT